MSEFFDRIRRLVSAGDREYSAHAVRKLAVTGILIKPLIDEIDGAIVVEEHPDYYAGPCVLLLQFDETDAPVHLLWGVPKGQSRPAVLITAYRPDRTRWDSSYTRRISNDSQVR